MEKQKLQYIIDEFDEAELKQKAFLGIYADEEEQDGSYIAANKEGLTLFALQFLKASTKAEEALIKFEMSRRFPFNDNEEWYDKDCDTHINYIQLIEEKSKQTPQKEYKETFSDKIYSYGCIFLIILIIIATITGFITIFQWII